MNLIYHQINVSKIEEESNLIKELQKDSKNVLIGMEVTLKEISKLFNFNIDPQHKWSGLDFKRKITCLEKVWEILPILKQFQDKQIHIFFLKTDLDSISAAAILDLYLNTDVIFSEEIVKRIKAIAEYDRHGRKNCSSIQKNISDIKIPRGLFMYISGWKNSIHDKVEIMKNWILDETFENINKYNKIAFNNFRESLYLSKIEIILPQKIIFVRSTKRGACGLGYKLAPVVIALNPSYRFGFGESRVYGKKWIIGQINDKHINMKKLLEAMREKEENWGGSATIIGSPQDKPSKLSKEIVVDTVKKILVSQK